MNNPDSLPRTVEVVSVGFDAVSIRHVMEALRARDLGKCREPEIIQAVKALHWIVCADDLLDGNLAVFIDALVGMREGAMRLTPRMDAVQDLADRQSFGDVWAELVRESLNENRSPEGQRRIVERLERKHGLSKTQAMRVVATEAGIQFDSLKKNLQRLKKRAT